MAPGKSVRHGARKSVVAGVEVSKQELLKSPATAPEKGCLIRANHTSVGRPQEEGMMSVAASFL